MLLLSYFAPLQIIWLLPSFSLYLSPVTITKEWDLRPHNKIQFRFNSTLLSAFIASRFKFPDSLQFIFSRGWKMMVLIRSINEFPSNIRHKW
jgi:hypothetical protein